MDIRMAEFGIAVNRFAEYEACDTDVYGWFDQVMKYMDIDRWEFDAFLSFLWRDGSNRGTGSTLYKERPAEHRNKGSCWQ